MSRHGPTAEPTRLALARRERLSRQAVLNQDKRVVVVAQRPRHSELKVGEKLLRAAEPSAPEPVGVG